MWSKIFYPFKSGRQEGGFGVKESEYHILFYDTKDALLRTVYCA